MGGTTALNRIEKSYGDYKYTGEAAVHGEAEYDEIVEKTCS